MIPQSLCHFLVIGALLFHGGHSLGGADCFPLAVVYTGEGNGYLEPCGCSRPQLGGLPRRYSLIEALRRNKDNIILVDNGDVVSGPGDQERIKFEIILSAMNEMGYVALNLGEKELLLGLEYLRGVSQIAKFPFISANLCSRKSRNLFNTHTVKTYAIGGKTIRVAVIGLLDKEFQEEIQGPDYDLYIEDPKKALKGVLRKIEAQSDITILLAHVDEEEAAELAKAFPTIDLVISGHERRQPLAGPIKIAREPEPDIWIVNAGNNGKYVGKVALRLKVVTNMVVNSRKPTNRYISDKQQYEVFSLDENIKDQNLIVDLLDCYQEMLKAQNVLAKFVKEPLQSGGIYVGTKACEGCHLEQMEVWRKSRHAHAYETLVKRKRQYDPECVQCHTTGFKYVGGFKTSEETPYLVNVGCEDCHGPGKAHVTDTTVQVQTVEEKTCLTCHTLEQSPRFDYKEYLETIEHWE